MAPSRTREMLDNPEFKELVAARAKLRWGLSGVTLVMFFGFIGLISTAKGALAATIAGRSIPLGLLLALVVIVLVVLLTGFYVVRSNARFDEISRRLNRSWAQ
ncbi:DUF485 domain-containing protein [Bradyrhizobium australafricanum]|uniref:DUF485 domain-containing protein n=1 Tax=Bradyrhizobium australafricanum TaxID=2821406 RepID=UPI001CE32633|nr:DUF485 domain-containing protein [Bradyrhizobium australafricanum]MCA6100527.1 DUF485 domain-containing protein [Bradyrhizobium australafricanum]